ncbi:MAG: hypothetical protein ACPHL6_01340, partial [Rubripirellula sp.]
MKSAFVALFTCLLVMQPSRSVSAEEQEVFRLLIQAIRSTEDVTVQASLLQGMLSGLEGRRDLTAPDSWGSLQEKLQKSDDPKVRERAAALARIFGDQAAVKVALDTVMNRE